METKYINLSELKKLENNPRQIKSEQLDILIKSIKDNPEYFEARPIIVSNRTGENIIIAGNQRFEAANKLKLKSVPVFIMENLTEEKEREIIIRDNVSNGDWDFELLADWNSDELEEWGVELPSFEDINDIETSDEFSLKDGDKEPFQQMTFTLADLQATELKNAIADIKQTDEYKFMETFGNENSNGNALFLIIQQWAEQKK